MKSAKSITLLHEMTQYKERMHLLRHENNSVYFSRLSSCNIFTLVNMNSTFYPQFVFLTFFYNLIKLYMQHVHVTIYLIIYFFNQLINLRFLYNFR